MIDLYQAFKENNFGYLYPQAAAPDEKIMGEEIRVRNEEEVRKVQKPLVSFLVLLAIVTGLILTSVALGVYGNMPLLTHTIPIAIVLAGIFPLSALYRKVRKDKNTPGSN